MADRYVDDGGDNTTGLSWATAYTSINALISAEASFLTTAGNRVFFGHDSQCQATNTANLVITGPSGTGSPIYFISATQGSSPPTYQQGTGNQIDTSEATYYVQLSGAIVCHGIKFRTGSFVVPTGINYSGVTLEECTFAPSHGQIALSSFGSAYPLLIVNCTIDLSADSSTTNTDIMQLNSNSRIHGLVVTSGSYRNGACINIVSGAAIDISGADFSSCTNASISLIDKGTFTNTSTFGMTNSKLPPTYAWYQSTPEQSVDKLFVSGSASSGDAPTQLFLFAPLGRCVSTTSIYRSNGASLEGTSVSWNILTQSSCSRGTPLSTPWIYGSIDATGSKTFDVYITNDTADLTDAEAYLEVEYKATSGSGVWSIITDGINLTTTPSNQTDDVTSTWNGTGPSFTYKQKLSVTTTINQTGQYRARVSICKASVGAGANFYVDPKVTVS